MSLKEIKESAQKIHNHLKGRYPPVQEAKLYEKLLKVEEKLNTSKRDERISVEDIDFQKDTKARKILKQNVYNWQPINFDNLTCVTYMVARVAQNYAVSRRILNEIKARDKDFKPQTLFDFGSGLGTVIW